MSVLRGARSRGGWRQPLTRQNCLAASSIPAAHQWAPLDAGPSELESSDTVAEADQLRRAVGAFRPPRRRKAAIPSHPTLDGVARGARGPLSGPGRGAEVIVATGSTPRRDGFQLSTPSIPVPGADLPHVFTSWDVLGFGGRATVGSTAVVYDDTGTFEAISTADVLVGAGASVTIISRMEQVGANVPYPPATVEASRERLFAARVRFVPAMALREITPTEVVVRGIGNDVVDTYPADTVVIVSYHEPNRDLADHLQGQGFNVHLAGDVTGTANIQAAIHGASALARGL